MKKIAFILSLLIVVMASCNNNKCSIEGDFVNNNYDGKTVYLQTVDTADWETYKVLDSTIVKDNKFRFDYTLDKQPVIGFLSVGKIEDQTIFAEEDLPFSTIVLESGTIKVTFDKTAVKLGGTVRNDSLSRIHSLISEVAAINSTVTEDNEVTFKKKEDLVKQVQDKTFEFTKENIKNKVGEYMFVSSIRYFLPQQNLELIAASDSSFQKRAEIQQLSAVFKQMTEQNDALDKMKKELMNQPFKDVSLMNRQGNQVALSSLAGKGKYILLDFWATWCAPCIEEIPNLVDINTKYKSKNLDIVGISLDEDLVAWHKVVEDRKMDWIHLNDAENVAAALYGVPGIPCTVLIDPSGTVVAINLRGAELQLKLADLLK